MRLVKQVHVRGVTSCCFGVSCELSHNTQHRRKTRRQDREMEEDKRREEPRREGKGQKRAKPGGGGCREQGDKERKGGRTEGKKPKRTEKRSNLQDKNHSNTRRAGFGGSFGPILK